jgi:hypothetical protein
MGEVPGVSRDSPQRRGGNKGIGKLRRRCLTHHDGAFAQQAIDNGSTAIGHPMLEQSRASCGALALNGRHVLECDGNAVEPAQAIPAGNGSISFPRGRECFLGVEEAEAVPTEN